MAGPYVYPNPTSLVGKAYVPDRPVKPGKPKPFYGECVSLLKYYIPEMRKIGSTTWIEGPNVIETLKNGGTIIEGTAIATFKNGRFNSGDGHAAFFVCSIPDPVQGIRIIVVEQFLGNSPSGGIITRKLRNRGKKADGSYNDPSNNGEAFSVIL